MFTVVLTDLTVFNKEKKETSIIRVIKDGSHVLTNSDIKKFIKTLKNDKIVPIEKSKNFLEINFTDIYTKPLKQVVEEKFTGEKVYTFTD